MNRTHDETSSALLSAAHKLLAEDGPEALTVRRIASEAGMSTMNVYSRFGGKDGVIDELYADGYRRLIGAIDAVPTTEDLPGDIIQVANAYRDFAIENPTYYRIMFRMTVPTFDPSQDSIDLALGGLATLIARVEEAQRRGDVASFEDSDAGAISAYLWATCHGLVSLELDRVAEEYVSWPTIFERGMQIALAGLHPSAAPRSLR